VVRAQERYDRRYEGPRAQPGYATTYNYWNPREYPRTYPPQLRTPRGWSPEYMVETWYRQYLGRHVDPLGIEFWGGRLRAGHPPGEVLAGVLSSEEYFNMHGGSDDQFVHALYRDLFNRPPTPNELQDGVYRLDVDYLEARIARYALARSLLTARR
jgi:hypothetical protein